MTTGQLNSVEARGKQMMKGRMGSWAAEGRLKRAFLRHDTLDLRTEHQGQDDPADGAGWTTGRQVRADFIAGLIREGNGGKGPALSLAGARVVGALDLRNSRVDRPLIMKGCYFDEPINLSGSSAVAICL